MRDLIAVSVIIPVFNCAEHLHNSFVSLLNQTDNNFEIVFIEDKSTDNSLELILEFSRNYPEIKTTILLNETNKGEGYSRNKGLDIAKGEFVCFVDADDKVSPDFIKLLVHKASQGYDLVYCGYDIHNSWDKTIIRFDEKKKYLRESKDIIKQYINAKNHFAHVGVIYRKSFLERTGVRYYEPCRFGVDIEFVCSVLLNAPHCSSVNQSLYQYIRRSNSISTSITAEKIYDCFCSLNRIQKKIPGQFKRLNFIRTRKAKTSFYLLEEALDQNVVSLKNRKLGLCLIGLSSIYILSRPRQRLSRHSSRVLFNGFKLIKQ